MATSAPTTATPTAVPTVNRPQYVCSDASDVSSDSADEADLLIPGVDDDSVMTEQPGQENAISSSHDRVRVPKLVIHPVSRAAARIAATTRTVGCGGTPPTERSQPPPGAFHFVAEALATNHATLTPPALSPHPTAAPRSSPIYGLPSGQTQPSILTSFGGGSDMTAAAALTTSSAVSLGNLPPQFNFTTEQILQSVRGYDVTSRAVLQIAPNINHAPIPDRFIYLKLQLEAGLQSCRHLRTALANVQSQTIIHRNFIDYKISCFKWGMGDTLHMGPPVMNPGLSTPGSLPQQTVLDYPRIETYIGEVLRRENFGGAGT